jgi:hypothetical protein
MILRCAGNTHAAVPFADETGGGSLGQHRDGPATGDYLARSESPLMNSRSWCICHNETHTQQRKMAEKRQIRVDIPSIAPHGAPQV